MVHRISRRERALGLVVAEPGKSQAMWQDGSSRAARLLQAQDFRRDAETVLPSTVPATGWDSVGDPGLAAESRLCACTQAARECEKCGFSNSNFQ